VLVKILPKKPESPGAHTPVPAGVRASERHTPPPAVIVVEALEVSDCEHLITPLEAEFFEIVNDVIAACAGAIAVNVPNASEATATADTFFNEIVFTIFLSFSQIKDDLLPGW